jgi:hypothetical protein
MIHFMKKRDRKIYFAGLRVLAKDCNLTQTDFAKAIGRDQTTVSNYMTCKTNPPDEYLDIFEKMVRSTREQLMEEGRQELGISATLPAVTAQATAHENVHHIPRRRAIEFRDREQGEAAMKALAEIELLDPGEFRTLTDYIITRRRMLRDSPNPRQSPQEKSSAS